MSSIRPFRRSDREQLTALVNAHVAAVIPAVTVSVNRLLNQLEREPDEAIVDPWVVERRTLVAIERDAVVAGAHLLRYGDDDRVSESYRNLADVRWLVCRPDATAAGARLLEEAIGVMRGWQPSRIVADGSLPAFGVYGVPDTWPHIRGLYEAAGLVHQARVEILLSRELEGLTRGGPLEGLTVRRSVGRNGTRFSALRGDASVGMIEVESDSSGMRFAQSSGWADIGNLSVEPEYRRRGIASFLLAEAADWLRRDGANKLLAYAWPEQTDELAFYAANGFTELVRTERGWILA